MRARHALASLALTGLLSACGHHSGVVSGTADSHCNGVPPPTIGACSDSAAATAAMPDMPMSGDYGATMYGSAGDDDDCKYHVSWSADDVELNKDVTFTVAATVLSTGKPLAGDALPRVEAFLNATHPGPNTEQKVTNPSAGLFHVGPVRFDVKGQWTVRFHFYEQCDDVASASGDSPHGHAAFYVDVP